MNAENIIKLWHVVLQNIVPIAWTAVGAIALWIIGGWVINALKRLARGALASGKVDATLAGHLESVLGVVLRILLVIAVLGLFGGDTTSVTAILAAVGVAVGMAWSGLLSNFAAGVFLLLLRPIRVGDFIAAGGTIGTVRKVGMFVTIVDTMDKARALVGNNEIFSDNITNYTTSPYRRVDRVAQLGHGVDPQQAMAQLKGLLAQIPNVLDDPAPDVDILEFKLAGTRLAVRPYCHNDNYWQVYFDTNKAIAATSKAGAWPVPAPHQVFLQAK